MKKMIFSAAAFALVAVSSIALAPTNAEAIPAFARQTGAACLSCHFQEIPALTAFGRSFKMNAFTDVGDQALVEDDGMSIPATLNATVVIRPNVVQTKTTTTTGVTTTAKSIVYGDQVILIAGRMGTNTGAFVELGGGAFGNHQFMNSFDVGGMKVGVSYYNTGFGEDAGLQLSNVLGQHGGTNNGRFTSANQNIMKSNALAGVADNIAGLTAWVGNDMGAILAGLIAPSDGVAWGVNGNSTFTAAKMVRANGFFDVGGLSLGVGGILIGGNVGSFGQFIAAQQLKMERTGLEASLEGEVGGMGFGLYGDVASAKKSTATETNNYNTSLTDNLKGWAVRGQVEPIHGLLLMAGVGNTQVGTKTDRLHLGASYSVYQNFVIALRQENAKNKTAAGLVSRTKTTTLDVEALM